MRLRRVIVLCFVFGGVFRRAILLSCGSGETRMRMRYLCCRGRAWGYVVGLYVDLVEMVLPYTSEFVDVEAYGSLFCVVR